MKERKKKKGSKTVQSEILSLRLAKKKRKKKDGRPLFRDKDYSFTALEKKQTSKTFFFCF